MPSLGWRPAVWESNKTGIDVGGTEERLYGEEVSWVMPECVCEEVRGEDRGNLPPCILITIY